MIFTKTYNQNNQMSLDSTDSSLAVMSFFLMTILIGLAAFYIFEVNSIATKGYEIKSYGERLGNLNDENQRLFLEKSRLSSFESIKSRLAFSNFSDLNKVSYLDIFESTVALNNQ